ncbi:MAG: sensor histidine kinase [Planctomycetota bacterium]
MSPAESRKAAQRRTAEMRQQRLAYIGTLAAGLAHEIRNPLNSIKMNVELIEDDLRAREGGTDSATVTRLERIRREAEQLQTILDEFLSFARPPRMEMVATDLNQYMGDMLDFFAPECERARVTVKRDFATDQYPVRIDPAQFKHVILNLLKNAVEAIGEQGEVNVATRELARDVEIRISDNGGGLRPGSEEKVFEVFFSTKERGTGLGLAIARRIVEEHGGVLLLENRPGQGASFVIRLPKGIFLEFEGENAEK